jgi:type-F conjugative transfer system secretin TraK
MQSSLVMGLLCTSALAQKTVVPFNEEERIVVKISNKSMNRLSVEGDRIQEVIGLNESVSVEKDGNHGHMFLKVPENSSEKIEVTLITEGGLVQDLTLQPINQSSTTLILKTGEGEPSSSPSSHSSKHAKKVVHHQKPEAFIPSAHLSNTTYQDALIEFMKVLYLGTFEDSDLSHGERKAPPGVSVSFSKGFAKDSFLCEAHELQNNTSEAIDLQERDFFQMGDVAIALSKPSLKAGQKTTLYLIRKDS